MPASGGGFGGITPSSLGPGPSPLVASYNEWTSGRAYDGGSAALPRDWQTFLSGMFGPLAPIRPMPVDTPKPGEERPEPRRWQYPVGFDMPGYGPGEGPGKLAGFATLRLLADYYSVSRACLELRKAEIRGIRWEIASTKNAAKAMRGDHEAMKDFAERQAKVTKFFRRPDPQYRDFSSWIDAMVEEIFVTDALTLYPHPPRIKNKGVLGSNLATLELIDGATVRPLVDVRGSTPQPPNVAYQSYLYGVPRVDLMTLVLGDDIPDAEGLAAEYRADQIMYLPSHPRVWTPYGEAAIERAIIPILTGIAKQQFSLNYFQEGTLPGVYISPGDANMTPSQIRELQDALNAIAGDQAWKHKAIVLPGGSKVDPQKPAALADAFDQIVMLQTCMAFDVMPMELGILPNVSATTTPSTVTMMNKAVQAIHQRKSTAPLLEWLKSAIFDIIVQDVLGQEDMEWRWEGLEENEDEEALTETLVQQIGAGIASIDEARMELGREPWGLPMTQDPGWATQYGGFQPLTALDPTTAGGQMPGQQKPARPAALPSATGPGARTGEMPGELPPTGMTTRPRNSMGHGQRADHAGRVSTARSLPAGQTPAHSGAAAVHANTRRAGSTRSAKAAERELSLLRSHLRKGASPADWEPRDLSGQILAMITEDIAKGLTPDEVCDAAAAMLGDAAKDAADLSDANPVEAEHVANQMRANYPEKALRWIADATWIGPVEVPQDRVNYESRDSWAASHEPGAVKRFAQHIKNGTGHTHPVVMVQEPGESKADVVDGHHRTLAYEKLGRKVKAYIGFVPEGDHRWRETHSFQVHQGADPANKAGGAGPKGPAGASGDPDNTAEPEPPPANSGPPNGSHPTPPDAAKQEWPGWFSDAQLAAEYARTLSASLAAAVNAGNLARDWLTLNAAHRKPPRPAAAPRRGKDQQAVRPAPLTWPAQKAQPPAQQQPGQPAPAPRAFLAQAGVIAALTAVLLMVLTALWGAAWAIGWAAASAVAGQGEIPADTAALGALLKEGKGTRLGWILQTLLSRLEKLLMDALRDGLSEDELAQQITDLLDSLTAALLITQSEITWAIGRATLAAYIKAGITYKKWQTRNDSRVCFPAGTSVATPGGPVAIESLKPDDLVVTPQGSRRVRAVSSRPYSGGVTFVKAEDLAVVATDDHPFWTAEGWRRAGDIKPGDILQSFGDKLIEVGRVVHLSFGDPQDMPPLVPEEGILDGIPFNGKLMPVVPVGLDNHVQVRQDEVDSPLSDVNFLQKTEPQSRECATDTELQHSLAGESAIATPGAESAGSCRRADPELLAALCTGYVNRRSTALFGTEAPVEMLLRPKTLTAPLAVDVLREGGLARFGADIVPVGHRDDDGEFAIAYGAGLGDPPARLEAGRRTVVTVLAPGSTSGIEYLPAAEALLWGVNDSGGMVAVSRTEDSRTVDALRTHDILTAMMADVGEWHSDYYTHNSDIFQRPLMVFNIEVEGEHVYYASGLLVHNCNICKKNQAAGSIPVMARFPSGDLAPLAHPRCRCALRPGGVPSQPLAIGKSAEAPVAAGLAVRAADTGRILMLQRAFDEDDPAGGFWEFPGGRLDDGEDALQAASREWEEEVGLKLPDGDLDGIWNSSSGKYRGFVLTVPSEDAVDILGPRDDVENPDDPDGDLVEALAWLDPKLLRDNPSIRPELAEDAKRVRRALKKAAEKSARTPVVSTVHHPLGHESLWHTPDKHVATMQSLPAYFQNTAVAIARDKGGSAEDAIPEAIEAVREWSHGTAFGGKVHVTAEVRQAAQRAMAEWERLKASHH
jgi:8-oxo-dGTP pyrophosphatase MutT (NUDIX family)